MDRQQRSSICSLAYGSLPEAGATVDTHLLTQCRPHYKPPSAISPVAKYMLPLPQKGTRLGSSRGVYDVLFSPSSPSLLLACTSEGTILTFDMNHGAFLSEMQVVGEHGAVPSRSSYAACVHVNRDPNTPLIFSGSPNGDVMVFDLRISGLSAKLFGQKFCPTLRLPSAHDGALCGIGTGVALHPQLFLTGGREDRWIRVFDLRFPFHYSSGGSSCGHPTPYALEARRLGPSEQDIGSQSLMAFDVSPDGTLLAASIARYRAAGRVGTNEVLEGADGETILISLPDGMRAIKTIASADGCAADFVQFSPNAKYILQTGGEQRIVSCAGSANAVVFVAPTYASDTLRTNSATRQQEVCPIERNEVSGSSAESSSRDKSRTAAGRGVEAPVTTTSETGGVTANEGRAPTKPLLFPLLHPQLSHFTACCGPLHPAFVRAEAATWPFKCRLWGGLVVGYGGSTADRRGCHRLYEGLKLWDSTTGVVLSWAEGELASEDNLRCIAPVPDVSTSLLVTGGYIPSDLGKMQQSAPSAGLTFWSLRRRDDLLMSALEGSLSLEVHLDDDSLEGGGD
ncbi:uncharacterized protein EMH_0060260 [Eimeria mitis]|uniref:WD domain, G-beta repeat-containing protein n=1 Tax=Eimeria mitis TaxID=44415 RepID=U6K2V9_9EIME|nr:uncharacterized protein EMH_0060260 [Eimeria mitis]CDJ30662.1 hypothetical protein, conserved [Eimeria mitis]